MQGHDGLSALGSTAEVSPRYSISSSVRGSWPAVVRFRRQRRVDTGDRRAGAVEDDKRLPLSAYS
jgi:hypothetical protein